MPSIGYKKTHTGKLLETLKARDRVSLNTCTCLPLQHIQSSAHYTYTPVDLRVCQGFRRERTGFLCGKRFILGLSAMTHYNRAAFHAVCLFRRFFFFFLLHHKRHLYFSSLCTVLSYQNMPAATHDTRCEDWFGNRQEQQQRKARTATPRNAERTGVYVPLGIL